MNIKNDVKRPVKIWPFRWVSYRILGFGLGTQVLVNITDSS